MKRNRCAGALAVDPTPDQYRSEVENSGSFGLPNKAFSLAWRANSAGVAHLHAERGRVSLYAIEQDIGYEIHAPGPADGSDKVPGVQPRRFVALMP
jgi:hypothetical protein